MNPAATFPLFLAFLQQALPTLTTSKAIATAVQVLSAMVPVIIQEYKDLLPVVKNIITALTANASTTPDQIATLEALNKIVDAEFEAALAARIALIAGT